MARELRASIEELETTSVWPPDPQEIYQSNIKIPKLLQLFLRNLFTSESDQFFLIEKKKKSDQCPTELIDLSNPWHKIWFLVESSRH